MSMCLTAQAAQDSLADTIWWLKGFSAAANPEAATTATRMERALVEVKEYLAALASGDRNFISQTRIVVTPRLIEDLADVLHRPELFTAADADDLRRKSGEAIKLHDQLNEWAARPEELPF